MSKQKRRNRPSGAISVRTYAELDKYIKAFANGHLNCMVLIGGPGLQKSQAVQRALVGEVCYLRGNVSPFRLYCQLYLHKDEAVVIDDVDHLYGNPTAVRLLKAVCQTDPVKTVTWETSARGLDEENVPREFTTTSHVLIITNEWQSLNENVVALEDRAHILQFEPDALEVHRRVAEWFTDKEVFEFIGDHLHLVGTPSMRTYQRAREFKQAGLDWRRGLLGRWLEGNRLLVARLRADASFSTEEDRALAFVEQGGGCRATYFNLRKKLGPSVEVPAITLAKVAAGKGGEESDPEPTGGEPKLVPMMAASPMLAAGA